MKRLCLGIIFIFLASAAFAAPPVPDNFVSGLIVETPGTEAIYAITIPEDVYRGIYRADLGDMRMFNARGEIVPHMLRRSVKTDTMKKEGTPPIELPFFPVYATGPGDGSATGIHVATNEKGVVVDVQSADSAADGSRLSAYLIDVSALEQRPGGLYIDWTDNGTNSAFFVDVEGSVDLNRWQSMTRNATLVKLDFGGHRLNRQVVDLPAAAVKYMRLSWSRQAGGVTLIEVKALFPDELSVNQKARQWVDLEGRAMSEKKPAYEYNSNAKFPVDAVNVKLPERNSLVRAEVSSRNEEDAEWRRRAVGVFYSLTVDGVLVENNPVSVCCTAERNWRLETGSNSGIGSGVPVLQLGWIPHELLFVARGQGPFTLAYGSAAVSTAEQPLDAMLVALEKKTGNKLVKEARIQNEIVLGGEKCLIPPSPPLPWKQWILWAVLIAGVAVLGLMVWRLFAQMNASGNREQ